MRIVPIPSGRRSGRRAAVRSLGVLVGGALLAAGCGGGDDAAAGAPGRLSVVAGFYPLAEAAQRVGGDRIEVSDLTPAGSEPHDLELVPDQVEDLEDADLVLVLGRGFQPAVEQVADRRDGATVAVLDAIGIEGGAVAGDDHEAEEQAGDDHEGDVDDHDEGHDEGVDPHVWLDPTLMAAIVDEVTAALVALDPEGATGYEEAAAAYRGELAALDASYREALDDCRRTTIVVAHEAFGWLASRYGLTQEGISGLAPGAEPSPTRLAELTDLVTESGVTTVFTETLVSPRTAEALAREAGVATAVLDPLEGLSDAQRAAGESYGTVMERNLDTLVEALGCT